MTPSTRESFWRNFGRTISLGGAIAALTALYFWLSGLADSRAMEILNYDNAHSGVLTGWHLIAGGALPIITFIFYFVACAAILWRFRAKK